MVASSTTGQSPPRNANPFRREPQTASPELATQLRATVEQAKAAGRVVQRLRQLEVPGGSLEGLPAQGKISRSLEQHEQEPPTLAEKELVEQFCSFQVRMRRRVVAGSFAAKGTRSRTIPNTVNWCWRGSRSWVALCVRQGCSQTRSTF